MLKKISFSLFIFAAFFSCTFRDYSNPLLEEYYRPPTIVLNSPIITNSDGSYELNFSVHDISGLAWIRISNENSVYQKTYFENETSDTFVTNFYYSTLGRKVILVQSSDSIGKVSAVSVIVDVYSDIPSLTINNPASEFTDVNDSNFNLIYSFNIQNPYLVTNIRVSREGSILFEDTLAQATGTDLSAGPISLNVGTNVLITSILADNGFGNSHTNTIIYNPYDPVINVLSPLSDTVTNWFDFSGNVSNLSSITLITFYTNGSQWIVLSNTNAWSLQPIWIGNYSLEIVAEDSAGNSSNMVISNLNVVDLPSGAIHVASWGKTNWSGSAYFPLNSIALGIEQAVSFNINHIYLEGAVASPGSGLENPVAGNHFSALIITNNNLNFVGGWNSNFTTQNGITVFDGQNNVKHVVTIQNAFNITLDHLVLRNAYADATLVPIPKGAGLFLDNVSSVTLKNMIVSNNSIASNGRGAGIAVADSDHVFISNTWIFANSIGIKGKGGGLSLSSCDSVAIAHSRIEKNHVVLSGGGMFATLSTNVLIKGLFTNNTSDHWGGGLTLVSNTNFTTHAHFIFNQAITGAGSYAFDNNGISFINNYFYTNSGNNGTLDVEKGGVVFISNATFTANIMGGDGGGIFLKNTGNAFVVDSFFTNNHADSAVFLFKDSTMNVFLSNNFIGMDGNGSTYGIYEGNQNIPNSIFIDNTFFTNTLEFLMFDSVKNDISDIEKFNSNSYIQCSDSHGNTEDFQ